VPKSDQAALKLAQIVAFNMSYAVGYRYADALETLKHSVSVRAIMRKAGLK
jgi:hypothetical protein